MKNLHKCAERGNARLDKDERRLYLHSEAFPLEAWRGGRGVEVCVQTGTCPFPTIPPAPVNAAERKDFVMRVLAVEDEPEYLEMLQEVMRSIGHNILIANGAQEGLSIIARERIDVIVSDVRMPGMDGIEFHERVRAMPDHKNTPFIFLTGISDVSAVRAVCAADCDLLLQKPFPVDRLLAIFAGSLR